MHKLQVRLCHLQEWVKSKGLRVILVFKGKYDDQKSLRGRKFVAEIY